MNIHMFVHCTAEGPSGLSLAEISAAGAPKLPSVGLKGQLGLRIGRGEGWGVGQGLWTSDRSGFRVSVRSGTCCRSLGFFWSGLGPWGSTAERFPARSCLQA